MTEKLEKDGLDEQSLREIGKKWGYYLLPEQHYGSPGHSGLLISIPNKPTGKHFDPERLYLCLRSETGIARQRALSRLALPLTSEHVCPGKLTLHDRFDKRIEFFTFGGSLEPLSGETEELILLHRSPAPILELTEQQETVPDQLAAETEALIGQIRAKWGRDDEGLDRRLAEVDPLQFYQATMQSLLRLWHERPDAREKVHQQCCETLLREKEWLIAHDRWPAKLPSLEDLLSPG